MNKAITLPYFPFGSRGRNSIQPHPKSCEYSVGQTHKILQFSAHAQTASHFHILREIAHICYRTQDDWSWPDDKTGSWMKPRRQISCIGLPEWDKDWLLPCRVRKGAVRLGLQSGLRYAYELFLLKGEGVDVRVRVRFLMNFQFVHPQRNAFLQHRLDFIIQRLITFILFTRNPISISLLILKR